MNELNVFVSVGGTATDSQEAFVRAVEDRLRSEGLVPIPLQEIHSAPMRRLRP